MSDLGRYTLVARVGRGGMAEIWKAKATGPSGFEKILAVKMILPEMVDDKGFIENFTAEAKLVAGLQHPNIVQVFDFGLVDGTEKDYFIAMEYVAGPNVSVLRRRLQDRGERLSEQAALHLVNEACKGLHHAHTYKDNTGQMLQIIHRDISPENILVSYTGDVKVTDFGIAKVSDSRRATQAGIVKGKLAYMSPEQANQQPLDPRTDLFSLGIVLYELLSNDDFYPGNTTQELFAEIAQYREPPKEKFAQLKPATQEVLIKALQADRDLRFSSAREMEVALTTALGSQGILEGHEALANHVQVMFAEEQQKEQTQETTGSSTRSFRSGTVLTMSGQPAENLAGGRATLMERLPRPSKLASFLFTVIVLALVGVGVHWYWTTYNEMRAKDQQASQEQETQADKTTQATAAPSVAPATPAPQVAKAVAPPTKKVAQKKAKPRAKAKAVAPAPVKKEPPAAAVKTGTLEVAALPWVEVWVDGKRKARETPAKLQLSAGRHTLRFVNGSLNFDQKRTVTIRQDKTLNVFVDTESNYIEIEK